MSGYTRKDELFLTWKENREQIELQGRQLLRRVLNEALDILSEKYREAALRGEVLTLAYGKDALQELLREQAQKSLGPGA